MTDNDISLQGFINLQEHYENEPPGREKNLLFGRLIKTAVALGLHEEAAMLREQHNSDRREHEHTTPLDDDDLAELVAAPAQETVHEPENAEEHKAIISNVFYEPAAAYHHGFLTREHLAYLEVEAGPEIARAAVTGYIDKPTARLAQNATYLSQFAESRLIYKLKVLAIKAERARKAGERFRPIAIPALKDSSRKARQAYKLDLDRARKAYERKLADAREAYEAYRQWCEDNN